MDTTQLDRFLDKVAIDPSSGCWLWTAQINNCGYGQVTIAQQKRLAHRAAYEHFVGPIPIGLDLDHRCRVRHCVNPKHLEPVTRRENLMRSPISAAAINAAKTHCPKGHLYDEANTIVQTSGARLCRTCQSERVRPARASQSIFDLAARSLGHDPSTSAGAEAARHDYVVWDRAEEYQAELDAAAHESVMA